LLEDEHPVTANKTLISRGAMQRFIFIVLLVPGTQLILLQG